MFTKNEQNDLLNTVESALRSSLHETFGKPVEVVLGPSVGPDHDAVLVVALDAPPRPFYVEVKSAITAASVLSLHRAARPDRVVFTSRLTPAVMGACRQLGIGCADADGNVFLRVGSSAVDIQGRPATESRRFLQSRGNGGRLTSRSGLQIVFVLLAAPELRSASLRTIAELADTSLGSAAAVVNELDERRFLVESKAGKRTLRSGGELLDLWVDGYRLRFAKRLLLGTFSAHESRWWETAKRLVRDVGGQWGGESALWYSDADLRPGRGIVYLEAIPNRLVAGLRLQRDVTDDARVELRRRFWRVPSLVDSAVAPSPLVYADLLTDGDPRLVEAAADLRTTDLALRDIDDS